jgi:hypothetical protein
MLVVNSGPFLKHFPSKDLISIKTKNSGEVKDSVFFPFLILLHKLLKPMFPPCKYQIYPNPLSTFANPPIHPFLKSTHPSIHPFLKSTHPPIPSTHPFTFNVVRVTIVKGELKEWVDGWISGMGGRVDGWVCKR